ncbi:MAG TPA: gliding motility-associated C-terminal domain-containing protein, partial [Chitinophagales bacterium]|nr:gliding motility-associated C-terminal domain-containing protein [Chitinophagales bacterium]
TIGAAPVAAITPATATICNGANTTLTANGGATYLWSNSSTTAAITVSPTATTTYTVTVTSAANCTATASATVTVVPLMSLSGFVTNVSCNGGADGAVNISVGGGQPSYTYQWSNNATSQSISGVPAGNYTVVVTDAAQCTASASTTVTEPTVFTVSEQHTDVQCNGDNTGSITLTPAGGTSPYSYTWNGLPGTSSQSGLPAGNYSIVATDDNQCSVALSIDITEALLLTIVETHTDVTCNGTNTGSIDITAQGGSQPYTYSWNDLAVTEDRTNIPSGNYSVTVYDNYQCSATATVVINQPQVLSLTESHTNVLCNAASTGGIDITATGGTSPYNYAWNDAVQTEDRLGIPAGNYTVTAYDTYQCSATLTVAITEPTALTVTETHTDVSCGGGADGAIDITVAGATAPYSFLWADGPTTEDRSTLSIGTYTVGVADVNQCTATLTINVASASNLNVTLQSTDVLCFGGNDGTITSTTTGGTTPYTYLWNDAAITADRTGLAQGSYTLSVTDFNQCLVTASVVINEPQQLTLFLQATDVACNGQNTGSIDVTTSGGTSPYNFVWSDMVYTEDRTGLVAGSYQLVAYDDHQCSATGAAVITEPAVLAIAETHTDVACNGNSTGSINVTVTGGVSPYNYIWADGIQTEDRLAIPAGNYSVTGTDVNLCSVTVTVIITEPTAIAATEAHNDVLCYGGADGRATITASQGTAPLTYLWNDGDTSSIRNGLTAATYTITVTDANYCSVSLTSVVGQPAAIAVTTAHTDVSCMGYADGTATVDATGGTPPYSYTWSNSAILPGNTNPGLVAGSYAVTVFDTHQCSATGSVTITEPAGIVMNNSFTNPSCPFKEADGTITLNITGGSQPYAYTWSNAASGSQIQSLLPGTYNVTVSDANNCSMADTFVLAYLYDFSIEVTPSVDIDYGESTTLGYTLTGIAGSTVTSWSPGNSLSCADCEAPVATPVNTTDYHVAVTNNAGCVAHGMVTVSVVPDYTVFVPNAFTPNNDGNNDVFTIYGNLKALAYMQMQIFNRWGEKVFESNDHQFTWDGTYKGELQPSGIYTWQLKLTYLNGHREEIRTGTLTMLR